MLKNLPILCVSHAPCFSVSLPCGQSAPSARSSFLPIVIHSPHLLSLHACFHQLINSAVCQPIHLSSKVATSNCVHKACVLCFSFAKLILVWQCYRTIASPPYFLLSLPASPPATLTMAPSFPLSPALLATSFPRPPFFICCHLSIFPSWEFTMYLSFLVCVLRFWSLSLIVT